MVTGEDGKNSREKKTNTLERPMYHSNVPEKEYGFFRFKPSCWQCCNNATGFLVVYSIFVIIASKYSYNLL